MQIESIRFQNFKLLRNAMLPLEPLTVIIGPNNSGKSSVFDALDALAEGGTAGESRIVDTRSVGLSPESGPTVVEATVVDAGRSVSYAIEADERVVARRDDALASSDQSDDDFTERAAARVHRVRMITTPTVDDPELIRQAKGFIRSFRTFVPDARSIRTPAPLVPNATLHRDGSNLAVVLDQLRDRFPERWEALNVELGRWLPEFDRVLFETPEEGKRSVVLRSAHSGHRIRAHQLSTGTLLVLALLAVLYAEDEVKVIGIEEPEIGVHPRLLRSIRDTLLRIAYPVENGEPGEPRQVIVTTHSPYFLDLFREDPDNVVIAERWGDAAQFRRLIDLPHIDEILGDSSLGDAWFSGILGGVPTVR
jgi:predicted ATPase